MRSSREKLDSVVKEHLTGVSGGSSAKGVAAVIKPLPRVWCVARGTTRQKLFVRALMHDARFGVGCEQRAHVFEICF
jgi:hypothetical protein